MWIIKIFNNLIDSKIDSFEDSQLRNINISIIHKTDLHDGDNDEDWNKNDTSIIEKVKFPNEN